MAHVYYVHWNEEECRSAAALLEQAGHKVECHWSSEQRARIDPQVDALVISLDRLPSHGRAIAEWFCQTRAFRSRPLIFVGGAEDKVNATREIFPDASYCQPDGLAACLARVPQTRDAARPAPAASRGRGTSRSGRPGRGQRK